MESLTVWFEIPATDMERARKFYAEVPCSLTVKGTGQGSIP